MSINEHPPQHVPVLLKASLEMLQPKSGETYLDLTAGYGGHAGEFLKRTENIQGAYLVDRDSMAIAALDTFAKAGAHLIHSDFVSAANKLIETNKTFDIVLVDLGVSSPQLDRAERGFSFRLNGPLDMRMDKRSTTTAKQLVNALPENKLTDLINRYGEESRAVARRYAKAIIKARPLETTEDLAQAIASAHIGRWQKTHPATRTFQAIRIALNNELEQVEDLLILLPKLLNKRGRVGIISFHSLEDRLVKRYFAEQASAGYEAELELISKKPRKGTEDVNNPRARSAILRVARKK